MDLHIKDRLLIPSIFPERGNFMDFNLKKRKKSELNGTFKKTQKPH